MDCGRASNIPKTYQRNKQQQLVTNSAGNTNNNNTSTNAVVNNVPNNTAATTVILNTTITATHIVTNIHIIRTTMIAIAIEAEEEIAPAAAAVDEDIVNILKY